MRAFIERIDLYPEKQKCGNWIRNIVFNFPIPFNGEEVKELSLSSKKGREAVILLSKLHAEHHIDVELKMDELDLTAAESKATYQEIKDYVKEQTGLNVTPPTLRRSSRSAGLSSGRATTSPNQRTPSSPSVRPRRKRSFGRRWSIFKDRLSQNQSGRQCPAG